MKVIFFGTSAFAVPSLQQLAAHHTVVLCVTQPDKPKGRGLSLQPSPVKQAAEKLGIAVVQPAKLSAQDIAATGAEVGVVASYGQLISRSVMDRLPHGILGVHPSLLPKYRGAAPVAWALLNGETETGVTIFRINEALDAGDLLSKQAVAVEPHENAESLTQRLSVLGAELLLKALSAIESGRAEFSPQDAAQASLAPKLSKAQGSIEWTKTAEAIDRLIRALAPWPGAFTVWKAATLKVWSARPSAAGAGSSLHPGVVCAVSEEAVSVASGRGIIDLLEVQLAGKRRMAIREFVAGHAIAVGDTLGD